MITLPGNSESNGDLRFWEDAKLFPEGIKRCFWISKVPEGATRGNHAHWKETQVLVAVAGRVILEISKPGRNPEIFELNDPKEGLLVPPMHWVVSKFYGNAVLLGLSDMPFSETDYIRDFDYFERQKNISE
ncbi:FdtA/QdtA family cupin domain-containing protein [Algoriphagus sp. CAU 1675]|uniref:sugar 3,4-ketoisomerase n=1 Tax=Algoriphagus sp. CAU 1675 TaxID=3032597 RepID=UPI0023D9D69C|nr:FdtA/QdtA family cupin domain-containing protein [Algoriphagus sp. CAU 1675]MDF2157151.1 FdtA/QdtA family cupin domain-containing protein [Algoriphagus sp. CAU 1675]